MQKSQLFHPQIQEGRGEEVGIEKILQVVPEAHSTQRGEKIKINHNKLWK